MNKTPKVQLLFNRNVLLVVAALAPLLFNIAQNQHMYSMQQIVASVAFIAMFCVVLLRISTIAATFIPKKVKLDRVNFLTGKVEPVSLVASVILLCLFIVLFGILLLTGNTTPAKHPVLIVCFYALISFMIGLGSSAVKARILIVGLYSFVLISLIHLTYGIVRDLQMSSDIVHNSSNTPSAIEQVQLKKKPNIYLFLLESFHSREILKDVYGINTGEFSKKLISEGYTLYDPIYANYYATLYSTAAMFRMDHSYYSEYRGSLDASTKTARLISGQTGNKVLDVLKNNGYSIAYIHSFNGIYRFKNNRIDYSNVEFPFADLLRPVFDIESLLIQLIRPLFRLNSQFRASVRALIFPSLAKSILESRPIKAEENDVQELMSFIVKSSKPNQPVFRFIYWIGAAHTDPSMGKISDHKSRLNYEALWKTEYSKLEQRAESEIKDVVQRIEKNDPGSLVILIGDHGAWLKGRMNINGNGIENANLDELRKYAADFGFTLADLTKDVSSVFMAIKWPKDVNVPAKQPISHVNLFRLIFSVLADDETLMRDAVPNTSYFLVPGIKPKVFTTVREGVVLDDWQLTNIPKASE